MFTYNQTGQNLDIRGVIRCASVFFWGSFCEPQGSVNVHHRYSDGAKTGLPGDPGSADPGPGTSGLADADGTTALVPLVPSPAPDATRDVSVTVSFQSSAEGRFLGFMNNTSWEPLSGTTTLLSVQKDPTGYAPVGVAVGAGDQLLWTEDSVQVLDLIVVCVFLPVALVPISYVRAPRTTWTMGITRSTCTVIVPGCMYNYNRSVCCEHDC